MKDCSCDAVQGIFKGIIGADALGEVCKPEREAFEIAFSLSGCDPKRTAMFEDRSVPMSSILREQILCVAATEVHQQEAPHLHAFYGLLGLIILKPLTCRIL